MKHTIQELDAALSKAFEKSGYSGMSVSLRGPEGSIFDKGYGYRNISDKLPIDENTVCGIASMGKSITALACCMLHVEGKMSIYDPVIKYFPDFHIPGTPDELVTVDTLMMHTTGIPPMEPLEWSIAMNSVERDSEWYRCMLDTAPNKMNKIEQIVDYITAGDYVPLGMPGEYMSYSNEGYAILSYIVDMASGTTLEEYMMEKIFKPIGMNRSILDLDCSEARELFGDNLTSLFEQDENGETIQDDNWSILPPFRGCACVKSTSSDMAKYYYTLSQGGVIDGKQAIPAEAVELLVGKKYPERVEPFYCGGLNKRIVKDRIICEHSGGLHGVSSQGGFTDQGYSATVLVNMGDVDPEPFIWICYNYLCGWPLEETHNWAEPIGKEFSMPEALCGDFLVKEGMPAHCVVSYEDGKLQAVYQGVDVDLLYCGDSVFAAVKREDHNKRVSTFKFFLRDGKAWAVRCYTRFYQRVEG